MPGRSIHPRRTPAVNRRHLSHDVRQRLAVHTAVPTINARLPLAQSEAATVQPAMAEAVVPAQPIAVQTQTADGEGEAEVHPGSHPSAQQIAERVYELMRQDLRLEREREGW